MKQEVIEAIKQLEDKDGRVSAHAVLEAARDESSPLHEHFEWDDGKAAEAWRLEQARELVRQVKITVVIDTKQIKSVCYVRDPETDFGYRSVTQLRTEKDRAIEALLYEVERAQSALNRAQSVAISLGLEADVKDMLQQLDGLRLRVAA